MLLSHSLQMLAPAIITQIDIDVTNAHLVIEHCVVHRAWVIAHQTSHNTQQAKSLTACRHIPSLHRVGTFQHTLLRAFHAIA